MESALAALARLLREGRSLEVIILLHRETLADALTEIAQIDSLYSGVLRQNNELVEAEQARREIDRRTEERLEYLERLTEALDDRTTGLILIGKQ